MGELGEYTAELSIYDTRNGELVKTLSNIEIENDALSEESIEDIEEFIGVAINVYENEDGF